jgi:arabinose-5-phosphate isomerase
MNRVAENVVRIEAEALRALADRLAGPMADAFRRAVELVNACAGRVVVTGLGKSGIVGRKIAATLSSTGTPALFLHPAEALHGDLGMVVRGDVVIALSASGETAEIVQLLPTIKRLQVPLISFTCDSVHPGTKNAGEVARATQAPEAAEPTLAKSGRGWGTREAPRLSTLAQAADVALDCSIAQEACSLGLAPTASTTTMMALGDALAMALAEKRGFKEEDFADLHPGGKLGKRLARVSALMHTGEALPKVEPRTRMVEVL